MTTAKVEALIIPEHIQGGKTTPSGTARTPAAMGNARTLYPTAQSRLHKMVREVEWERSRQLTTPPRSLCSNTTSAACIAT